jgi:HNH endonuclease
VICATIDAVAAELGNGVAERQAGAGGLGRQAARNRCGYCLSPQHLVMARLEIEHILPRTKGGSADDTNLWLACPLCNSHKSDTTEAVDPLTGATVALFNPRTQSWWDHFTWADDGIRIIGTTPVGRATIAALHLSDDPDALTWTAVAGPALSKQTRLRQH